MPKIVAQHFPIFVPGGHMGSFSVLADHRRHQATRVRATMDVPKSSTHLLRGYDEVRQFIAALPARTSTDAEAHVHLRPLVSRLAPGRAQDRCSIRLGAPGVAPERSGTDGALEGSLRAHGGPYLVDLVTVGVN